MSNPSEALPIMSNDEQAKAQEIADKLTQMARELGAANVVVAVSIPINRVSDGLTDAAYHVAWSGDGMGVRGLAETAVEKLRILFARGMNR